MQNKLQILVLRFLLGSLPRFPTREVTQSPPAKLLSTERSGAWAELKVLQERIKESMDIALVGAGAVGVQLATDIKSFYPEKKVTLIHSRA
ncbi:hypothetical protein WAI453_001976 [Rhynchosporium graminicola]